MDRHGEEPAQERRFYWVLANVQQQGAVVAMVGDGVNDAAVLSGADVSFALGGGAALAQLHADCVLLGQGLASLWRILNTLAHMH